MTEPVVVSVRGTARTTVPPDRGSLSISVQTAGASKAEALDRAADVVDATVAGLAALGGVVTPSDGSRVALSWLVGLASSHVETRWDDQRNEQVETGRVLAHVHVGVEVRDFALLDRLAGALGEIRDVHTGGVGWSVDPDNAAWGRTRTEAVRDAIAKARDYADALGGSVVRIDQLADSGLLADDGRQPETFGSPGPGSAARSVAARAPQLDPVPLTVSAAVEARFTAAVPPLEP